MNAQLASVCFFFSFLIRVSPVKWLFFLSHMYPHLSGLAWLHGGGDSRPIGTWNPGVQAWLARHWTACICCSVWSGAAMGTGLLGWLKSTAFAGRSLLLSPLWERDCDLMRCQRVGIILRQCAFSQPLWNNLCSQFMHIISWLCKFWLLSIRHSCTHFCHLYSALLSWWLKSLNLFWKK